MIKVETDTTKGGVKEEAEFRDILKASDDVQEFTRNVGLELKAAVLATIVTAQDEYIRVIQYNLEKPMGAELRDSLKETIFNFVKDIDQDEVVKFREMVTG